MLHTDPAPAANGDGVIMSGGNGVPPILPEESGAVKRFKGSPELTKQGSIKEKVVNHGFLSTCVEIHLEESKFENEAPKRVLEKRMVPRDMAARSMGRWLSACAGFRSEIQFYRELAAPLAQRGLRLAAVYGTTRAGLDELEPHLHGKMPPKSEEDAVLEKVMVIKASIVMELLSPEEHTQIYTLQESHIARIFESLAWMHGATFEDFELLEKAQAQLCEQGGHWSPFQMRGWFSHKLADLPSTWKDFCATCTSKNLAADVFSDERIINLGVRLANVFDAVEKHLRMGRAKTKRSIIHGDMWSGNILFPYSEEPVVMIDFQFSGVGIGAMDVAYLLLASTDLSILKDEEVKTRLLTNYIDLVEKASNGRFQNRYDLEELKRDIKYCTVEIVVKWFAGVLQSCGIDALEGKPSWDGRKGTFCFLTSPEHYTWFIWHVHGVLQEIEAETAVSTQET